MFLSEVSPSFFKVSIMLQTTMKFTSTQSLLLALIAWFSIKKSYTGAFVPSRSYYCYHHTVRHLQSTRLRFAAPDETTDDDPNNDQEEDDDSRRVPNDLGLNIVRGSPSDIPDDIWEDIEGGAPSRWMVMKDVGVAKEHSAYFFVSKLMFSIINLKLINCKHITAARN